jgi:apolipoprotein N-acyltransferase
MFKGLFRMHESCAHCGLKYEREPGYFLGSIYINYGVTAFLLTAGWIALRYGFGFEAQNLLIPFAVCLVVFQTLFFRYARALWLAMDCRFDRSLFADQPEEATDGRR